jgi:hypothetical protein
MPINELPLLGAGGQLSAACGGRIMGAMFNARRTGLAPRAVVAARLL